MAVVALILLVSLVSAVAATATSGKNTAPWPLALTMFVSAATLSVWVLAVRL